jgi:hypothetical protein
MRGTDQRLRAQKKATLENCHLLPTTYFRTSCPQAAAAPRELSAPAGKPVLESMILTEFRVAKAQ